MRQVSLPIIVIGISLLLPANAALALASQTWVSPNGTDAGGCPITSPCKTFQFAHNQTANNGVINVLAAGNFGPLTIIKSISIVADGVEGAIYSSAGGAAIIINGTGVDVSLRGLTIDLFNATSLGINFVKGTALHVQDVKIRGTGNGIRFAPTTAGNSELHISDTVITKGQGDGFAVAPSGNYVRVIAERVRVENQGGHGFAFDASAGAINATLRDSVASGNNSAGLDINGNAGHPLNVMLNRFAAINNGGAGIIAQSGQIRMGDSTVSGNTSGLSTTGGTILSYGNNQVNGNFPGGDGTAGSVLFK